MPDSRDIVVLGAGLTGLSAATQLGDRAVVLERTDRPGGLVKSVRLGDHWFDDVLHLLYFWDDETRRIVTGLMGDDLASCPPIAWVETSAGTTRFPFQMHLGTLPREVIAASLTDLARKTFAPGGEVPDNFRDMLLETFGETMCETFLFPYNRKMWKRPLEDLAPSGFQWNIARPNFEEVLKGALDGEFDFASYNAKGWYPRPAAGAPVRGMEVLSRTLASRVADLRLNVTVERIDLAAREVRGTANGESQTWRWNESCLSTLPMPVVLSMCGGVPAHLTEGLEGLTRNRVVMVYMALEGPRPGNEFGHWRYYGDESVCFTRLVSMTQFDPGCAPDDGWALMAEITEPAESELGDPATRIEAALADARRVGAITSEHRIIATDARVFDPAYVVFTPENHQVMETARSFLREHGLSPLGRFGRWEYSSMAQCMRDGFRWGRAAADRLGLEVEADVGWQASTDDAERA